LSETYGRGGADLLINIDGASLGNPGAAGIGLVICDPQGNVLAEIGESIGTTTNNVAEYTALVRALEEASRLRPPGRTRLVIRTDSELLQRQMTGAYKIKAPSLRPLAVEVMARRRVFAEVRIVHVPREENWQADKLAGEAAKKGKPESPAANGRLL